MDDEQSVWDQQVDALLRQVDVPQDLRANLLEIAKPEIEAVRVVSRAEPRSRFSRLPRVFAWSSVGMVAAVGLFFAVQRSGNSVGDASEENVVAISVPTDPAVELDLKSESELQAELALLSEQLSLSQELLLKLEIAQLESQIAELQRASITNVSLSWNDPDTRSMLAAVQEETFHLLGGSEAATLSRMRQIQTDFPGTRGAELATDYISKLEGSSNEQNSNL